MPFIAVNGQLFEVTQAQYDSYTIGDPLPTGAVLTSPGNVAAGGTVTESNSATTPILTPNTANNTPGQILPAQGVNASASPGELDTAEDSQFVQTGTGLNILPEDQLQGEPDGYITQFGTEGDTRINAGTGTSADSANALRNIQAQVQNAQAQQTISQQRGQVQNGDWRVRLRLAPQANYLYRAPQPGILQPLAVTDGVLFPYTPLIDTSYRANYDTYDLTHSNYRGYFYKNSYVDAINIKALFTAQDTNDANYLLAVIHFFRSVTKMFYGQDAQRGAPPPLVYLTGLGEYQFNEQACVISQFQYNLPDNVDYIRAGSPNQAGLNLSSIRARQDVATNSVFGTINRLAAAFLNKGAVRYPPPPPTLGLNRPTYVPTKIDINLTLLPVQSRQQVSKQFSVKEFANGNLIKGGFW